uniref:Uncharacterized protein LOC117365440 isoform X3 n=1 Tax=Geotrypetes seraphini TaxID=260995 RepID=A0A6P8S106_GEOSA|nr:uncharacterized protein LOC117365440 isoform X3 [Geotrypetes seraphini]
MPLKGCQLRGVEPFLSPERVKNPWSGTMTDVDPGEGSTVKDAEDDYVNLSLKIGDLQSQPRDHCDYLLDAIDAQLNQLQTQSSKVRDPTGNGKEGICCHYTSHLSHLPEMRGRPESSSVEARTSISFGVCGDRENSDSKKEQYKWRLKHLLGSEQAESLEYQSDSQSVESICTEDFVAKFKEGMVDPIEHAIDSDDILQECEPEEKLPQDLSRCLRPSLPAEDTWILNTIQGQNILQQLEDDFQIALTVSNEEPMALDTVYRTNSLESLGGRISRLSQNQNAEKSSAAVNSNHILSDSQAEEHKTLEFQKKEVCENSEAHLQNSKNYEVFSRASIEVSAPLSFMSQPLDASQVHNPGLSSFSSNPCCHIHSLKSETGYSHQEEPSVRKSSLKEHGEHKTSSEILGSNTDVVMSTENAHALALEAENNAPKHWCIALKSTHGICSNLAANPHHPKTEEASDCYFPEQAVWPCHLDRCELPDANSYQREGLSVNSACFHLPDKRRPGTIASRPVLEIRSIESSQKQGTFSPAAILGHKHVAGVPVMSFDGVVIDSDLDSVRTEKVRAHIHKAMASKRGYTTRGPLANRKESLRHRSSDEDASDDEPETFLHRSPDCTTNCRWDTQTDSCKDQKTLALENRMFAETVDHLKDHALKEQATSFRKEIERLVQSREAKDAEIIKLSEEMQVQKDAMKQEAKDKIQSVLLREQRKWEMEKKKALQMQHEMLEMEKYKIASELKEVLEREKKVSLALQNKSEEFQTRLEEQEKQIHALQREKQEVVEQIQTALREEKLQEMKRNREEIEEEQGQKAERLKQRVQQLEEELHGLRTENSEASFREREAQAQAERTERSLVREVNAVAQRLQNLLEGTRTASLSQLRHRSPSRLSPSQVFQSMHEVSDNINHYIQELLQEIEGLKRTACHIQREKEQELKQQREQFHLEKEAAVDVIKERLVKEHIEEITTLKRNQLRESGGSENQTLRQLLRDKDNELRAIQRNMTRWKDETTGKLARKFEEELNAELEKQFSKNKHANKHRNMDRLETSVQTYSQQDQIKDGLLQFSTSAPYLNIAPVQEQHDFGALKLLRHLQGKVRELRTESTICHRNSLEEDMLRGKHSSLFREKAGTEMDGTYQSSTHHGGIPEGPPQAHAH